jgi:hypothetical protein
MDNDHIPQSLRDALNEALYVVQRHSGRSGSEIVFSALSVCKSELIAAVGHKAAAHLLRSLADAVEAEGD